VQIHKDVLPLRHNDYSATLSNYVREISGAPGVVAVFQFGEISHPGISDLDLLVVVSDDVAPSTLQKIVAATRANPTSEYLFAHPPVVVPRVCAGQVAYIHSLDHLRQVWGERIDFERPAADERPYLSLAEYIDFTFAVRTVLRAGQGKEASLRWLLLLLKSCVRSLRLASAITDQPHASRLAYHVGRLRDQCLENWGTVPPSTLAVSQQCVRTLNKTDSYLEAYLNAQGIVRASPIRECVPYPDGRFYVFEAPYRLPNMSIEDGTPPPNGLWKRFGVDPSVETYPAFYLAQFATYGKGPGSYAAMHRAVFGVAAARLILPAKYNELLAIRLELVQRAYDRIGHGGLVPMVPLGIGFRAPEKIRLSWRRRLLRGVVAKRSINGTS